MQVRRQRTVHHVQHHGVGQLTRRLQGDEFSLGAALLAPRPPKPGCVDDHSPVGLNGDLDFSRFSHRLDVRCLARGLVVNSGDLAGAFRRPTAATCGRMHRWTHQSPQGRLKKFSKVPQCGHEHGKQALLRVWPLPD
jgi:hypothetical protein